MINSQCTEWHWWHCTKSLVVNDSTRLQILCKHCAIFPQMGEIRAGKELFQCRQKTVVCLVPHVKMICSYQDDHLPVATLRACWDSPPLPPCTASPPRPTSPQRLLIFLVLIRNHEESDGHHNGEWRWLLEKTFTETKFTEAWSLCKLSSHGTLFFFKKTPKWFSHKFLGKKCNKDSRNKGEDGGEGGQSIR